MTVTVTRTRAAYALALHSSEEFKFQAPVRPRDGEPPGDKITQLYAAAVTRM